MRIDLHTHSIFSDGIFTADKLVFLAKKRRISVLSLTDHDSVSGIPYFLSSCNKHKIKGISGIELSAKYSGVLHILGYRFNHERFRECGLFKEIRDGREERNAAICEKLQSVGIDVCLDEISKGINGDVIGRPHIARVLVKKGYVSGIKEAFVKYLDKGAVGYVSHFRVSPEKCISLIRENGGLPVLAHPWQTNFDIFVIRKLAAELKEFGLWGIECYSNCGKSVYMYDIMKLAGELGLYVTAGSDFHGDASHGNNMGIMVPDDVLPWARFCGGL